MLPKTYHRSISFPAPNSPAPLSAARRAILAKASYRTRSASLPTRLHPLSAHLDSHLAALIDCSNLADSLALLHLLLDDLPHLLLLPQSHLSPLFAIRLLDDFLLLADAHHTFRRAALDLKHAVAATRISLRRSPGEPRRLSSCVRAQRRAGRHVARIVNTVRDVGRRLPTVVGGDADVVMRSVVVAAAAASAAVFGGVAAEAERAAPAQRTWLEEGLMRWRSRARAKGVLRKEIGDVTVENALLRWLERARKKKTGESSSSAVVVEGQMSSNSSRKWLDRALSKSRENHGENSPSVEGKKSVENGLRRWLARAKARSAKNGMAVGKKKKGNVEAGLRRWLSRAKVRMGIGNGGSPIQSGESVVTTEEENTITDEVNEVESQGSENSVEERKMKGKVLLGCRDYELQKAAMKRLTVLEDRVAALENGSELVFRDLINVRVALLNILTPCF